MPRPKSVATAPKRNGVASLNTLALVPALAVLGDPSLVGDGNFTLTKTADGVHAEKVLVQQREVERDGRSVRSGQRDAVIDLSQRESLRDGGESFNFG